MHRSTRPNPLYNLLPNVATLVEVQGARLFCFLRQIAFSDVDSKSWNTGNNSMQLQCIRSYGSCSLRDQCVPSFAHILRCEPESVTLDHGVISAHAAARDAFAVARALRFKTPQRLNVGNLNARCAEHVARIRSCDPEKRNLVA